MPERVRPAHVDDADLLVELMSEFYAESSVPLVRERARDAFLDLLGNSAFGAVWILMDGDAAAGYGVLTFGYTLEYGGRDAFVDDLFVRPAHRGRGLGSAALEAMLDACRRERVRAVHLEAGFDNDGAKALYARFGFVDHRRQLLTRPLEVPLHGE
jgi:GNAT superfamily N-acetyltransferase